MALFGHQPRHFLYARRDRVPPALVVTRGGGPRVRALLAWAFHGREEQASDISLPAVVAHERLPHAGGLAGRPIAVRARGRRRRVLRRKQNGRLLIPRDQGRPVSWTAPLRRGPALASDYCGLAL